MIRRLLVLAVAAVLAALAGCAQIPVDGPVMTAAHDETGPRVRALVPPPAPGAGPEVVVRGFLRAGLSPNMNHAAGRAYMAGPLARTWRPGDRTLVHAGELSVRMRLDEQAGVATALVTVPVVYEVDELGHLSILDARTDHELEFRLERTSGQWRITRAPDLTLLAESDFGFVFTAYVLYFLDPTLTYFVPEPRWLPPTEEVGSRLVDLTLAGPPQWLQGAATTAFPAGTTRTGAVEVGAGTDPVEVPLSTHVADSPEPARGLMGAQLLATLQQVSAADDVRLSVQGRTVDAPEVSVRALPESTDTPVMLRGRELHHSTAGTLEQVRGLPSLAGAGASDPAVDYGGARFAVLTGDRTRLRLLQEGRPRGFDAVAGPALTPPSFDWRGWVWTADSDGVVHAVSPDRVAGVVRADLLRGRRPLALRIAPEGVRAAVLSTDGTGSVRIDVVAVQRDERGRPHTLAAGPDSQVAPAVVAAGDLTWAGGLDLLVLARTGDDPQRPLRVQLWGPPHEPLGRVVGGERITAASTLRSALVGTSGEEIFTQAGAGWVEVAAMAGAHDPAYPG